VNDGAAPQGKKQAAWLGHKRVRSGEDFDIIIGFLGFWAVVLLVVTVWMEVTAQPALGWALGLLAILLALYGMIRLRRRLPARTATRRD
jgi:hypothetical protein